MLAQRIGIIVQARMSSSRLPGKMLRELSGKPLLVWLLEGLATCSGADMLAVATSIERSDDPISNFCARAGVSCFRGPLDDVAGRFLGAAEVFGLDALVRICGDSPFIDPGLVDAIIAQYREGDADIVSNVRVRTFPKGQSVEVFSVAALRRAIASMDDALDREHVTRFFYANPGLFTIRSVESGGRHGELSLCVDTPEDMTRLEDMTRRHGFDLRRPSWHELVRALETTP